MIALLIYLALCGFISWIILQIPMPQVFKNLIMGIAIFLLVIKILQMFGVHTGIHIPD